jgi:ATP-dependent exoDNAse (exonuclease V) alpha subunit
LAAARQAWEASGHRVVGASLAARAAAELHAGSGIASFTLDRVLRDLDRPGTGGFAPRTVVVIDEAAMVGTRKLARLLAHAEAGAAKVILVGDHRQLPEIDAGGAFAGLARRLGTVTLHQNRRQHEAWERTALAELRHGDVSAALTAYQGHGRIHTADSADAVRERLVDDWWAARQTGGRQLMVATLRTEVDDLNRRARARLIAAAGVVDDDPIRLGGRHFAVGDQVLALRNDYSLGVLNGTRATILALDWKTGDVTTRTDTGAEIVFPYRYVEDGHLTHGYATTLHKAQGATLNQAFVLADDTITRQRGYSSMSRGTDRNDLYAVGDDEPDDDHHARKDAPDPLEQLWTTLARSQDKTMAIDEQLRSWRAGRAKPGDSIDLSVNLSRHRPRTGLQRRLDEALGIRPHANTPERATPPAPDTGIDGPDIGW